MRRISEVGPAHRKVVIEVTGRRRIPQRCRGVLERVNVIRRYSHPLELWPDVLHDLDDRVGPFHVRRPGSNFVRDRGPHLLAGRGSPLLLRCGPLTRVIVSIHFLRGLRILPWQIVVALGVFTCARPTAFLKTVG